MNPITLLASDLHLAPRTPACRSEQDWLEVQRGYLKQVSALCQLYHIPLAIAGDLFHDGWRSNGCPPRVINLAIDCLPTPCYALPGQHDLENHSLALIERTAFWTLVQSGRVIYIPPWEKPGDEVCTATFCLYGFPWGHEPRPCPPERHALDDRVRLAVVHRYVWLPGHSYEGAPEEARLRNLAPKLAGYDAVLTGDNHSSFLASLNGKHLFNGGTLIRRRADEIPYKPAVGLLYPDGSIKRHFLDTSGDRFVEPDTLSTGPERDRARGFLCKLDGLGQSSLDFQAAVLRVMDGQKVTQVTRELVLRCLGFQR